MNCFNEDQLKRISHLVHEIEKLTDVEKLFLYLQLPCGRLEGSESIEGKSKVIQSNGGGHTNGAELFVKKPDQETTQTYTWILSHLEVDPNVSLPKQEVYDEYRAFCHANRFEPLCVADFGKAMKHAFPCIKPRRLGQRGNSRYCYSGLRKKYKIEAPNLPDLSGGVRATTGGYHREQTTTMTYCQAPSNCYGQIAAGFGDCRLVGVPTSQSQNNGVINLKIESTNNHHHHHQFQPISCGQPNCGQQQGYAPDQRIKNSLSMVVAATSNASETHSGEQMTFTHVANQQFLANGTQQQPQQPLVDHDQQQSQNKPIGPAEPTGYSSQPVNRYDDYMGVIQQPGSPDDDDYQHNYQHASPLDRHLFSMPTAATGQQPECAHSTTSYLHQMNVVDSKPMLALDSEDRLVDEVGTNRQGDMMAAQQQQQSQMNLNIKQEVAQKIQQPQSNAPQSSDLMMEPANQQQQQQQQSHHVQLHNLSYIADPMMDHCASPFQSPASTPYPTMVSSYLGPNLPDYYSTNDCIHYTT